MINTVICQINQRNSQVREYIKTLRSQWAHGVKDTFIPTVCDWKWKWHDTNSWNTGVHYESKCGKVEASAGSEQHLLLVGAPSCWHIWALSLCCGIFLFREQYRTAGRRILYIQKLGIMAGWQFWLFWLLAQTVEAEKGPQRATKGMCWPLLTLLSSFILASLWSKCLAQESLVWILES